MGKNHHYVPQVYLRRFSADTKTDNKRIWTFDKSNAKAFHTNIRNVASKARFYSLREEDVREGVSTEFVEDTLSKFEGDYVSKIDDLLGALYSKGHFSVKHKFQMARYIILQVVKTKTFRNMMTEVGEKDSQIYQYEDGNVTEQDIALMQAGFIFNPIKVDELAKILCRNIWFVGRYHEPAFYTSDTPVVYRAETLDGIEVSAGFASPGLELALPLNPHHLLMIFGRDVFVDARRLDCGMGDLLEGHTNYYNIMQFLQSYRYIFSYNNQFDFARAILDMQPDLRNIDRPRLRLTRNEPDP